MDMFINKHFDISTYFDCMINNFPINNHYMFNMMSDIINKYLMLNLHNNQLNNLYSITYHYQNLRIRKIFNFIHYDMSNILFLRTHHKFSMLNGNNHFLQIQSNYYFHNYYDMLYMSYRQYQQMFKLDMYLHMFLHYQLLYLKYKIECHHIRVE